MRPSFPQNNKIWKTGFFSLKKKNYSPTQFPISIKRTNEANNEQSNNSPFSSITKIPTYPFHPRCPCRVDLQYSQQTKIEKQSELYEYFHRGTTMRWISLIIYFTTRKNFLYKTTSCIARSSTTVTLWQPLLHYVLLSRNQRDWSDARWISPQSQRWLSFGISRRIVVSLSELL